MSRRCFRPSRGAVPCPGPCCRSWPRWPPRSSRRGRRRPRARPRLPSLRPRVARDVLTPCAGPPPCAPPSHGPVRGPGRVAACSPCLSRKPWQDPRPPACPAGPLGCPQAARLSRANPRHSLLHAVLSRLLLGRRVTWLLGGHTRHQAASRARCRSLPAAWSARLQRALSEASSFKPATAAGAQVSLRLA